MDKINIQFSLFSAFYSPLISAMSGGFLKAEGLAPAWSISPPGVSAIDALKDGSAHVIQSALSQGFTSLNQGKTPAAEIARAEKQYFPDTDEDVLADCIATYQQLGCWTPHVEITRAAYERTLDVFEYNGLLRERYRYGQVCAAPPATD